MATSQWVGGDGNRWINDNGRVWNAGSATATGGKYWADRGYVMVLDPNAGGSGATNWQGSNANFIAPQQGNVQGESTYATTADGGAGGADAAAAAAEAAKRAANEAGRVNTQKAIDSLGTELDTGYRNIDDEAASINSRYDKESTQNESDFEERTVTNTQNLQKNKQNALLAGAQGARGLRSTLSALGALGGDGVKLANRAVTTGVNQDIGEAADTFAGNSQTLTKAITKARDEDKDRRAELETQKRNQRTALEGKVESKRQSHYQKMADLFGEVGDVGNATSWLNRAGDLNGTIAAKTAVQATPFSARAAAFTPGQLADYLAGAGDMTVTTSAGDATGLGANTPSTILAGRKERERKQQAVAA